MIPLDDAPAAGGRRAAVREREEAVIASLRSLGPALDGEPDPAFRMATRARLVAMAAVRTPEPAPAPRSLLARLTALRPEPSAPAWSPVRRRLTAGLAGGALAVTAVAALVAVATGASPGDPLYDLKRGTEQTQLALSGSDRGLTLLGFAHTRLTELAALAPGETALAVQTLRDMDDETTAGAAALTARAAQDHDAGAARLLASWGADQSAQLAGLRSQLPAGAQPAADSTAALLVRVSDRGTALAAALGCATGPSVAGTDPLGPVPLACASPTPNAPAQGAGGGGVGSSSVPGTTGTQAVPTPATGGSAGAPPVTGGSGGPVPGSPAPGGAAPGGPVSGGSVPGGSNPGGVVPTVPALPTTGIPSPTVPRTGTGKVPPAGTSTGPLPGSLLPPGPVTLPPLPGSAPTAGNGGAGTTSSTSTGNTGLPGVSVCVPQVSIGSC